MSLWLLVMTVHFAFLAGGHNTLDLPGQTIFQSADRCWTAGKYIASSLEQDGTTVEWRCIEIHQ